MAVALTIQGKWSQSPSSNASHRPTTSSLVCGPRITTGGPSVSREAMRSARIGPSQFSALRQLGWPSSRPSSRYCADRDSSDFRGWNRLSQSGFHIRPSVSGSANLKSISNGRPASETSLRRRKGRTPSDSLLGSSSSAITSLMSASGAVARSDRSVSPRWILRSAFFTASRLRSAIAMPCGSVSITHTITDAPTPRGAASSPSESRGGRGHKASSGKPSIRTIPIKIAVARMRCTIRRRADRGVDRGWNVNVVIVGPELHAFTPSHLLRRPAVVPY